MPCFTKVLLKTLFFLILPFPLFGQAFDLNCYFPVIGKAGELDTIYGSKGGQNLGAHLLNLGPEPGGSFGRIAYYGHPQNPTGWTSVATGYDFDLRKQKVISKMSFVPPGTIVRRGYFRSKDFIDIFVQDGSQCYLYWGDEQGNYDTSRVTRLGSPINALKNVGAFDRIYPAIADFDNDGLLDIVATIAHGWVNPMRDSIYVAYYGGRATMDSGARVMPDSIRFWFNGAKVGAASYSRRTQSGDFRGAGREDVILSAPYGQIFFYRNEGVFSFEKYMHSVWYDTIFAPWQNPKIHIDSSRQTDVGVYAPMQVLARPSWDKALDLILAFPARDNSDWAINIYRGGSDFGSRRIFIDSSDERINHPGATEAGWDAVLWPGPMEDCGDMTGTGNKVIRIGASVYPGSTSMSFFYVTGKAIDSKIDMFVEDDYLVGYGDTITANSDKYQDYIMGSPVYRSMEDHERGVGSVGTIHLLYGTPKIPVKLNPKYSVMREGGDMLAFSLNFRNGRLIVQTDGGITASAKIIVQDVLGRIHDEQAVQLHPGAQLHTLDITDLSSGAYLISVVDGTRILVRQKFSIAR